MIEPAQSFDRAAAEYERARPEYPAGVLDLLPLPPDATVLDLGAGTGKLTRLLATRYRHVIAVEPLDRMREILEQVVPCAKSLAGTAESIPVPDASVDGVFAAQAFHWFANDDAVTQIGRVLRPGGVLCVVWNEPAEPSPLPGPYRSYLRRLHAPSLEAVRSGPSFTELIERGPFEKVRSGSVAHRQLQDRACVLAFAQSVSWIAHREADERERIMRDLEALLPAGPFAFEMCAHVNWAGRR